MNRIREDILPKKVAKSLQTLGLYRICSSVYSIPSYRFFFKFKCKSNCLIKQSNSSYSRIYLFKIKMFLKCFFFLNYKITIYVKLLSTKQIGIILTISYLSTFKK